jgi:quinol monooxygenase YgiN
MTDGEMPPAGWYVVTRSPDDEDLIFVTEVWSDPAAHAASLDNADTRALIARAMPLLAQAAGIDRSPAYGRQRCRSEWWLGER